MKIFVCDNAAFKFSQALIDHWTERGHEVYREMGMNPKWAEWADITFVDWVDQNVYCLYNGSEGDRSTPPYPKKRLAVRGIDIDLFQYRHLDSGLWAYLDDFIVISKWWYDRVKSATTPFSEGKLHLIPMGVDLSKFTMRENKERGYKIACVTGNLWEIKDGYGAIRIFQELVRLYPDQPWELYIRGQYFPPDWRQISYEHLINVSGLGDRIHIVPHIDGENGMRDWYHTMDYTLVTSHKEAFSFAAAEGMACGLKPIINNFFGSDDIWDKKYRFSSIHEACEMIGEGDYEPEEYRSYIQDHHNIQEMFRKMDELFGT